MSTDRDRAVVVRADAGRDIGAGHVVRTLTLADELGGLGYAVTFVGDLLPELIERIRSSGHGHRPIDGGGSIDDDVAAVLGAATPGTIVVVDHYGLDARWESAVGADGQVRAVVAIDDLADRPHDADVLVDHNWYGDGTADRYRDLVPPRCRLLLGPEYALLQPTYREGPGWRPDPGDGVRVVVSFGGTDPTGSTLVALEALELERFRDWTVDVVVGTHAALDDRLRSLLERRPNTHLHVAVPSLAPLYRRAHVAIGAGGSATWERLACGVPAIVVTTSAMHSGVSRQLDADGVTTWLGVAADVTVDDYAIALTDLARRGFPPPPRLVDGYGARRVAHRVDTLPA